MPEPRVLVLNTGSSTLKAALVESPARVLARTERPWPPRARGGHDSHLALASVLDELGVSSAGRSSGERVDAVGHRVVHGGSRYTTPVRIDERVVAAIEDAAALAPQHNPVALEAIAAARELLPHVPHVASFDTAFHSTLAPEAYRYPVPEGWYSRWGVRRFGFHGLSVAWSVRRAAAMLGRPPAELCAVVAHLGSGCSVTAVEAGRSVDTSMGMTTLEGPMMSSRSGSVDPGVPFYLAGRGLLDFRAIGEELSTSAGLLGVSGTSGDMRRLQHAAKGGDEAARLAIAMFVRRAAAWVGSMATAIPRLDALVFTGGIGEAATEVRREIVARLGVLGLDRLPQDPPASDRDLRLDDGRGRTAVLRVGSREDLVIAEEVVAIVGGRVPVPG